MKNSMMIAVAFSLSQLTIASAQDYAPRGFRSPVTTTQRTIAHNYVTPQYGVPTPIAYPVPLQANSGLRDVSVESTRDSRVVAQYVDPFGRIMPRHARPQRTHSQEQPKVPARVNTPKPKYIRFANLRSGSPTATHEQTTTRRSAADAGEDVKHVILDSRIIGRRVF